VIEMVLAARDGDLALAREKAVAYQEQIEAERQQAEDAVDYLEQWMAGEDETASPAAPMTIGQAAERLCLTRDSLRSWERDGLLTVPRNPENGYRQYMPEEIGRLLVIRVLVNAGYSHMAILRLMLRLDSGEAVDSREVLDTPRADEEIFHVTDRWLTTLDAQAARCEKILEKLAAMQHLIKS